MSIAPTHQQKAHSLPKYVSHESRTPPEQQGMFETIMADQNSADTTPYSAMGVRMGKSVGVVVGMSG
jgi:hypothetical protein